MNLHRTPLKDRLLSMMEPIPLAGCWIYTGPLQQQGYSYPRLARIFGVSKKTVFHVCTGRSWQAIH
jgi:hypothetical protein